MEPLPRDRYIKDTTSTKKTFEFHNLAQPEVLDRNKYDFDSTTFPVDLEGPFMPHSMAIHIYKNNSTEFDLPTQNQTSVAERFGIPADSIQQLKDAAASQESRVDKITAIGNQAQELGQQFDTEQFLDSISSEDAVSSLNYSLLTNAINLYMPATAVYTYAHSYEDVSLTNLIGDALRSATGMVSGAASRFLGNAASVAKTGLQLAGMPINPRIEVLFANTPQRNFQFEFLLAPRNQGESQLLQNIIKTLRFHAAPERYNLGLGGFLWIAPSHFEIKFYHNGVENYNIPRIGKCALTQIDVDYAPSGVWSTFTNGYPVQTRLQLQFKELRPIDKDLVNAGY